MPQSDNSADPLLGSTVAGKYKILSTLGSGGMGSVYLAQHESLLRLVAIKVMRESSFSNDVASVKRFQVEASSLKALEHENIVRIYAVGQLPHSNSPFIVLEHLEGSSIADALEQHGCLPLEFCWSVFEQLSAGLAHAHAKNILHRDIKPGNLMFSLAPDLKNPATCRLKIVDFGVSKLMESETLQKLTQTGALIGTPLYMSPEQLLGMKVSAATDVYSAGCVMYECLFGMPPFTGDSFLDIAVKQTESPIVIPDNFPDERPVPVGLRALLSKALAKKPNKRISDGQELHNWLTYVRSQPHVVPELLKQTIGKPGRRLLVSPINKLRIPRKVATVGLVVMIPAIALSYLFYDNIARREHAEEAVRRNIHDAVLNCRDPQPDKVRPNLEQAQAEALKFPELQTDVNNGVLEATKVLSARNNVFNDTGCWLLREVTKVPFDAHDPSAVERHLRYYCQLQNCAASVYPVRNDLTFLNYIDESAPELVKFCRTHKSKAIPELQQAIESMTFGAKFHETLIASVPDQATRDFHQKQQILLLRSALDILEHYPLNAETPKLTLENTAPTYMAALLQQGRFTRGENYARRLMTDRNCVKRVRNIWFMPPYWASFCLLAQGKNPAEAEKLLQGILAGNKHSKLALPNASAINLYLGVAQSRLNKLEEALLSLDEVERIETGLAKTDLMALAEVRARKADLYRRRGMFDAAEKHIRLAKTSMPPVTAGHTSRAMKILLEAERRTKNRDRDQ